jgi:hypothetical protein
MPGGQGPTVAAAQNQGKLTPQMVATAMQLGIDPKRLESIVGAQNIGRPEVKHWADVRNPDGSVSVTGFDQFGDPRNTGATPYKAPEFRDLGGSVVGIDPITMKPVTSFGKTMTPGERDSSGRGWANINFEREKWADQQKQGKAPKTHYDPARGVVVNEATGTASPVTLDGKPIGDKATADAKAKRESAAGNVLNLLDEADKLLEKSTASYAGAGVDLAARGFGISTPGSQAAAQLKALEGAIMMAQPRMEGPQSNYDVELYRQMAGSIGDATLPAATRKAAIETVRALHNKYVGGGSSEIPGATDIQRAAAEELKRRRL